jgi:hypothetical protein
VLLFSTIYEAQKFCKNIFIHDLKADKPTKMPAGALVFSKDTHPSSFYMILKGSIALFRMWVL